jgi:antitoxin MazE
MLSLDGKPQCSTLVYIQQKGIPMNIQLAKWGNSLAVRIPAEYVRHAGLKAGDALNVTLSVDGGLNLRPPQFDRKSFAGDLTRARKALQMTSSVVDELRRGGAY